MTVLTVKDATLKGSVKGPTFTGNVDGASFTGDITYSDTTTPPIEPPPSGDGPAYQLDPNAFKISYSKPTLLKNVTVATNGTTGNGANTWGRHQTKFTRHDDGTLRLVYCTGSPQGANNNWRLMKSTDDGASWRQEATAQTFDDVFLFRDPATDTAHVIGFPGGDNSTPAIYSSPNFSKVAMPGWPSTWGYYRGAGIGPKGKLVVSSYYDADGNNATAKTHFVFQSASYNGSSWSFGSVQDHDMGHRKAYHYVMPGAFGNDSEVTTCGLYDCTKQVAGVPNINESYLWDGIFQTTFNINSATPAIVAVAIQPTLTTISSSTTSSYFIQQNDMFATSGGKLISPIWCRTPSKQYYIQYYVTDRSGAKIRNDKLSLPANQPMRMMEDAKHRLWMISIWQDMKVFPINTDLSVATGSGTQLLSSIRYEAAFINSPRGGNRLTDSYEGYMCKESDGTIQYFKVRLPNPKDAGGGSSGVYPITHVPEPLARLVRDRRPNIGHSAPLIQLTRSVRLLSSSSPSTGIAVSTASAHSAIVSNAALIFSSHSSTCAVCSSVMMLLLLLWGFDQRAVDHE